MKKVLQLVIISLFFFSCDLTTEKELFFLEKNAYEYPVWEEMLLQEKIKFSNVVQAFKAYSSTHRLDEETLEHFEKLENRIKLNLDSEGYYISKLGQYKKLLAFRQATRGKDTTHTDYTRQATSFRAEIPNNANYGQWKNEGPFGDPEIRWSATGNGAVQYLEMHPTNPAIMYACTRNGGLWKTINYGKNWTPETDYFATNNTSCLEISPVNTSIFYLGAAEDQKVWYSTDSGVNWEDRSLGISGSIYDIHSDPTDATRVLAATSKGIYLTTDSGLNWTQKLSGRYTDIDLTDNWDFIVVSDDNANVTPVLNFSKDKGDTFIEKNIITHLTEVDRFYLAIHKPTTGATQVFAYGLDDSNTPTRFIGLWKSDYDPNPADGTSYFNFTEVKHPTYTYPNGAVPLAYNTNADGFTEETSDYYGSINPYSQATWISDFYVSPNNPDWMLTLREKFWGSDDGGIIWSRKPSYGSSNWADNRYVTTNVAKDTVYWTNDGGMWAIKENDLFPTEAAVTASGLSESAYINSKVVHKNGDICVPEGSQMDVSQMNKGVFMTGGQDVGQIFTRNGRDSHVASADVYRGRIKPTDDSKFITGRLNVQLDGETDTFTVYNNIEPDHFNSERLYGFTNKNSTQDVNDVRLVRSPLGQDGWLVNGFRGENAANAGGHSWTPTHNNWEIVSIASSGITNLKAGTFEQSRANAELAFLGDESGNKLFYTENLSSTTPTWVELPNAPQASRYRIATHQYNENIIVIATNIGVYISKNKGQTWIKKGNFPETNPKSVLIDKNTSEGIYVLTALTIYYIDENLTQWVEFNKGLPLQNHTDMRIAYYPNNDNRLYTSKYGRGIWSSSLQSVLNNNGDKPIAAFSIHGNSTNEIFVGEKVMLLDQSSNATGLQWTIENGSDVISISDQKTPEVTLSTPGYYKVTLVSSNTNGSNTLEKEYFILINPPSTTPDCVLTSTGTIPWYKRQDIVRINTDTYDVPSTENYIASGKNFKINYGESSSIYVEDNYHPGYNFYTKAWIDYNNDGSFDGADEEIADSGGKVESFTANFTPPNSAVLGQPLLMRVSSLESSTAPTSCQTTGTRQTIDFLITIEPIVSLTAQHTLTSENSADLQASFTGASNVVNAGFVYSKFDGLLIVDNSSIATYNTSLANDDSYTKSITDLEYNATYYYRPFVRDQYGIYYGEKQSFQLAPYTIPLAESVIANNLGNNEWELKGLVFPENVLLEELSIEYGSNDFSNNIVFDPSSYSTTSNYHITTNITTTLGNSYQFRIKFVSNGNTYYSSPILFTTGQTICNPTVANSPWYKRIKNVTFDGNANNSSGNTGYEDFSNLVYNVVESCSYEISVTDSYSPGYNLSYIVYVDYNNDGDFNDYHEVAAQGTPNDETFTSSISIPTEDVVYNTNLRMRVIGYNGSLDSCGISTGQIEDYTLKITPINTWTGTTSSDWSVASNWSLGSVPDANSVIVIPKTVNNSVVNASVTINKMTIHSGASLTVNGSITNMNPIIINSDATSSGSLIVTGTMSGNITYNRYIKDTNWHLVAAPVTNQDINNFAINTTNNINTNGSNYAIAKYVNDSQDGSRWNYYTTSTIGSAGNFISGKGYSTNRLSTGNFTFEGEMATSDVAIDLVTTSGNHFWSCIGNPYPSFIAGNNNVSAVNLLNENSGILDPSYTALYFWDGSSYLPINQINATLYVPVGQAFMVRAKSASETFVFSKSMQTHLNGADTFYRTTNNISSIIVNLSNSEQNKTTEIKYLDDVTTGLDVGYDAGVYQDGETNFSLATHLIDNSQGIDFALQCLPKDDYETLVVPLSVKASANEELTFSITTANLPSDLNVYLEDRENNTIQRINDNSFHITIANNINGIGRFYIYTTRNVLHIDDISSIEKTVTIYKTSEESLRVIGLQNGNASSLKIYSTDGKEIFSHSFKSKQINTIDLPNKLTAGVYIVRITSDNKTHTKKIFIE